MVISHSGLVVKGPGQVRQPIFLINYGITLGNPDWKKYGRAGKQ